MQIQFNWCCGFWSWKVSQSCCNELVQLYAKPATITGFIILKKDLSHPTSAPPAHHWRTTGAPPTHHLRTNGAPPAHHWRTTGAPF